MPGQTSQPLDQTLQVLQYKQKCSDSAKLLEFVYKQKLVRRI